MFFFSSSSNHQEKRLETNSFDWKHRSFKKWILIGPNKKRKGQKGKFRLVWVGIGLL